MYPLLFDLGPIPIHTYGFLIAAGFLLAIFVVKRLAQLSKLNVERTIDLTFWSLIVGFVGARILFVLTRLNYFVEDPASIFKVWEGGLVFFGGPLAVVPFAIFYMKKHKLSPWKTADVLVPGLVLNHAAGRLGCLAAGCCYGKPTGTDFGIQLTSDLVERHLQGINLHPTQVYEASALLILFVGLLWIFRRKQFDGQVVLSYFIVYPIIRSIVEIYRGDLIRGFVIENWISTSQFISMLVFLTALGVLWYRLHTGDKMGASFALSKSQKK